MSEKHLLLKLMETQMELVAIHKLTSCLATASHESQEGDTSTITGVRNLIWLWRCEIEENKRLREALEFISDTDRFDLNIVQEHAREALEEEV